MMRFISSSSKADPMPPLATSTTSAPTHAATSAFDAPMIDPTPTWPVPSRTVASDDASTRAVAARIFAFCSASRLPPPSTYCFV